MRYIKKTKTPQFFKDATADLSEESAWDDFKEKQKLTIHILEHEQDELCVYCEGKVSAEFKKSHLEHLKPKSKYPKLKFTYENLVVSCMGNLGEDLEESQEDTCGHWKKSEYEEGKFLDPTKEKNISDYFTFNDDGEILADGNATEKEKAEYMIEKLNLNGTNESLAKKRADTWRKVRSRIKKSSDKKAEKQKFLTRKKQPFRSFIRFKLKKRAKQNTTQNEEA